MGQVGARAESPLTLLREYLTRCARCWPGSRSATQGRYVRLDRVQLDGPPRGRPPVLAGAEGPRTLRLVGGHADGTILTGGTTPAQVVRARELIEAGRAEAGRTGPHPITVTCWRRAGRTRGTGSSGRPGAGARRRAPTGPRSGRSTTSPPRCRAGPRPAPTRWCCSRPLTSPTPKVRGLRRGRRPSPHPLTPRPGRREREPWQSRERQRLGGAEGGGGARMAARRAARMAARKGGQRRARRQRPRRGMAAGTAAASAAGTAARMAAGTAAGTAARMAAGTAIGTAARMAAGTAVGTAAEMAAMAAGWSAGRSAGDQADGFVGVLLAQRASTRSSRPAATAAFTFHAKSSCSSRSRAVCRGSAGIVASGRGPARDGPVPAASLRLDDRAVDRAQPA